MHLTDGQIAGYPEYAQESTGGGSYDLFGTIADDRYQQMPNSTLRLGQIIRGKDGNWYQYVRAAGNMVAGDVLTFASNTTGTVSTADATSDNIHSIITNITGITSANQEVGNQLLFAVAGLSTVRRFIKGNTATASSVTRFLISVKDNRVGRGGYDADAPSSAIAGTTVVHILRRYSVVVCGVAGIPVGVARHAVTSGQYTLMGIHGLFLVKAVGSTDALVENAIVVTAASGNVKGTLGTATAASAVTDATTVVGIAKFPYVGASALVPIFVNTIGRF